MGNFWFLSSRISMRNSSGVTTNAWSVLPLPPGNTDTPAAFHRATDSWTFGTMKPTWFTTDPTVPPVGVCSRKMTSTPGNRTRALSPWTSAPPIAKKIFLVASMLRVLRCQCPMVTPASFGVNACPHAIPAESTKIPHKAKVSFFTTYSFLDCQMCDERLPKLRINIRQVAHVEKVYRKLERAASGSMTARDLFLGLLSSGSTEPLKDGSEAGEARLSGQRSVRFVDDNAA